MFGDLAVLGGALGTALAFAALAIGLGRLLLGPEPADAEGLALAAPLGVGGLGLLAFGMLATDLLRRGPLALAFAVLTPFALRGLFAARRDLAALRRVTPGVRGRLVTAAWVTSAAGLALLGLYPPTAWDATIYHLPFARAFAEAGGYGFVSQLRMPVFPLLAESLFAMLRIPGGELAAQEIQAFATLATAGVLAAWTRARLPSHLRGGALAAAIYLGSPIVVLYAGTAYVEPLLTLFVTAALAAADRFLRSGEERFAALSGGLAGCAAGVKYLGLPFAFLVPASTLLARRRPLRVAALAATLAALALAPWYGRIVALTGNPLFPFATHLFGPNEWSAPPFSPVGKSAYEDGLLPDGPGALPTRLAALPRLPFDLLFARERYNHQPPFTPALLLLWPALLLVGWRERWSRPWITLLFLYLLCLTPLPADSRYVQPVLPLVALLLVVALAAAGELGRPLRRRERGLWSLAAVALWLPLPAYLSFHLARQGPIPLGAAARAAYLERHVPGLRALWSLDASRAKESTVYLLHFERLHYFAVGEAIGEFNGPARYALVEPSLGDPAALAESLRRLGADHLLLPAESSARLPRDEAFAERFSTVARDGEAELLALRERRSRGASDRAPGQPPAP